MERQDAKAVAVVVPLWETTEQTDARWTEPGYVQTARMKGRLAALFVRTWTDSLRVVKDGWENNRRARSTGRPVLYVIWHGSQVVPLACYRNRGILILTSLSRDGDIQTQCMDTLGFRTIRGSSSRGGARALLGLVRELRNGGAAALTVDGPRGPYRQAKPGAVLLAQRSGAVLLPVANAYGWVHQLKNWDRFEIPLPFSRVVTRTGEPFQIPESADLESGCRMIEERLIETGRQAMERLSR